MRRKTKKRTSDPPVVIAEYCPHCKRYYSVSKIQKHLEKHKRARLTGGEKR